MNTRSEFFQRAWPIVVLALLFTLMLMVKSVIDFSRTGPTIAEEIVNHYAAYSAYALGRLAFWVFVISTAIMTLGAVLYANLMVILSKPYNRFWGFMAAGTVFGIVVVIQFSHHLLYIPSAIDASFLYRLSRLYPLWDQLSPERIQMAYTVFWGLAIAITALALIKLYKNGLRRQFNQTAFFTLATAMVVLGLGGYGSAPAPVEQATAGSMERPNIIMIGSDTLRADRLGAAGYHRNLTPYIDALAKEGVQFTNNYVALARTAPSLASMLTATWPHTNGIRDNYVADDKTTLPVTDLATELKNNGYRTAVIADWAGGDLGKLSFGFEDKDLPTDQWNIKYLIRQGPKDIRLFLSLFTHNHFGKGMLPEVYYLAGTPLSHHLEIDAQHKIKELAEGDQPFLLTLFTSNTHLPFGSQYPYYRKFADPAYMGESRFAMTGLGSPEEIIKKQSQGKHAFDIQQIVDLYDGAVNSFDDTVKHVVEYIKASGLDKNTIIVIFSDHGVDLFEKYTWGQGNSLLGDDPSARVPLIIIDPNKSNAGRIVETTTRAIDVVPTLLERVAIPVPDTMEGISLSGLMQGKPEPQRYAFHETGIWLAAIPGMDDNHLKTPSLLEMLEVKDKSTGTLSLKPDMNALAIQARDRMVRSDQHKLIYLPMEQGAEWWLFDTATQNQIETEHPRNHAIKDTLINWMASDPQRRWEHQQLVLKTP